MACLSFVFCPIVFLPLYGRARYISARGTQRPSNEKEIRGCSYIEKYRLAMHGFYYKPVGPIFLAGMPWSNVKMLHFSKSWFPKASCGKFCKKDGVGDSCNRFMKTFWSNHCFCQRHLYKGTHSFIHPSIPYLTHTFIWEKGKSTMTKTSFLWKADMWIKLSRDSLVKVCWKTLANLARSCSVYNLLRWLEHQSSWIWISTSPPLLLHLLLLFLLHLHNKPEQMFSSFKCIAGFTLIGLQLTSVIA